MISAVALSTIRFRTDAMHEKIDIAALKAGDETEFRNIVELLQDRVYRICYGFIRSPQEAEDVAQEVFIEVFNSIGDFREAAQISTWVHRIAVTKSIEAIRRRRRKKRLAFLVSDQREEKEQEKIADQSDGSNPAAMLENAEREQVLTRALDSLPDLQRIAFTLHKVEGLSHEEITKIMGNSLASVESLIHRAKASLQKRLYKYYAE